MYNAFLKCYTQIQTSAYDQLFLMESSLFSEEKYIESDMINESHTRTNPSAG